MARREEDVCHSKIRLGLLLPPAGSPLHRGAGARDQGQAQPSRGVGVRHPGRHHHQPRQRGGRGGLPCDVQVVLPPPDDSSDRSGRGLSRLLLRLPPHSRGLQASPSHSSF